MIYFRADLISFNRRGNIDCFSFLSTVGSPKTIDNVAISSNIPFCGAPHSPCLIQFQEYELADSPSFDTKYAISHGRYEFQGQNFDHVLLFGVAKAGDPSHIFIDEMHIPLPEGKALSVGGIEYTDLGSSAKIRFNKNGRVKELSSIMSINSEGKKIERHIVFGPDGTIETKYSTEE